MLEISFIKIFGDLMRHLFEQLIALFYYKKYGHNDRKTTSRMFMTLTPDEGSKMSFKPPVLSEEEMRSW